MTGTPNYEKTYVAAALALGSNLLRGLQNPQAFGGGGTERVPGKTLVPEPPHLPKGDRGAGLESFTLLLTAVCHHHGGHVRVPRACILWHLDPVAYLSVGHIWLLKRRRSHAVLKSRLWPLSVCV